MNKDSNLSFLEELGVVELQKLAELGDPDSLMMLGNFMDKVIQEDILSPEQLSMAEEAMFGFYHDAAEKGHIEAGIQYALAKEEKLSYNEDGSLVENFHELPIDEDVLEYLQRGALDKDPIVLQYLGSVYEEGRDNLPQSDAIAMKCYKAAHLIDPKRWHEYTHFKKEHTERALKSSEKNDFTEALEKLLSKLGK